MNDTLELLCMSHEHASRQDMMSLVSCYITGSQLVSMTGDR